MTVSEVTDLPRYVAWVDGFIPLKKSLISIVDSDIKDDLLKGNFPQDDLYLRALARSMYRKYHAALGSKRADAHGDIYIVAPNKNPLFPAEHNPIHVEFSSLEDRIDDYRLFCMVLSTEECNELREAFLHSLQELKFEMKPDDSYKDLSGFKGFLHDLSESIVDLYYAPSIQVKKDLKSLGCNALEDTVS